MILPKKHFINLLLFLAVTSVYFDPTAHASQLTSSNSQSATNMTPVRKNYPNLKQPIGFYVHAVKHNGFLFLSGITAFGSTVQNGTIAEQTDFVYSTIASIAEQENTNLSNLIKVTIYVTNFNDVEALRTSLFKQYGDNLPASSLVQVNRLFAPDLKIEVEAVIAVE